MNITHLEHTVIALLFQALFWPLVGRWVAGSLIVAVFLGREIAQHEYAGGGANEVWYLYGLFNHWSLDSVLDVLTPAIACTVLALLMPGSPLWKRVKARR
ncbi:hypothetical protein B0H98_10998 [Vreelandella songnenensis]|uniref:Uncharacterized protein n=1 Tax=Vreelandella songnenensis TaxID=1176243 RepID=A0A2T0UYT3_9GAMM|nr:hypothetical protein [Halomonas songnenensis]PRY63093.1 hypothetical protein B0H98_10998 [Halomonas songnenensis]